MHPAACPDTSSRSTTRIDFTQPSDTVPQFASEAGLGPMAPVGPVCGAHATVRASATRKWSVLLALKYRVKIQKIQLHFGFEGGAAALCRKHRNIGMFVVACGY